MIQPGKVQAHAYYDEDGRCHSIEVALNHDGVSREDVAEVIRALFYPGALPVPRDPTQFRHNELGRTEQIPAVRVNGSPVVARVHRPG